MDEKARRVLLFLFIYLLMLWIGFRVGEIYGRMKNKKAEDITVAPKLGRFFIVEEIDHGTYSYVNFSEVGEGDAIMKFYQNEKLKPLLKLRKLSIYTAEGDRIY